MIQWQLQDAKNQLSELISRVLSEGPQIIAHQDIKVVVMPLDKYQQLTAPPQRLGDFFLSSPLRNSDLILERNPSPHLRPIDL